jgi:tetratricopeptide (TPR) repeat protein
MSSVRTAVPKRYRPSVPWCTAIALAAVTALAATAVALPVPGWKSKEKKASSGLTGEAAKQAALAEKEYAHGVKDAEKGTRFTKEGKTAEATAAFAKALPRFEEAVRLYEDYADAWNMLGYCSRQVGDLKRAFDAYERALAIDPDHEEAHEYLGEAYEQLLWLRDRESEEADELAEMIEAAERDAAASDSTASDSTATGTPDEPQTPDAAGDGEGR